MQRHHLVEHTPQHPNVTGVVVTVVLAYLGRQVVRGACHGIRHLLRAVQLFADPEVAQFELALLVDEHILGFDVPVENAFAVQILHSQTELGHPEQEGRLLYELALFATGPQEVGEITLGSVVHEDAQSAGEGESALVGDDEGVGERREEPHLLLECVVLFLLGGDYLEYIGEEGGVMPHQEHFRSGLFPESADYRVLFHPLYYLLYISLY